MIFWIDSGLWIIFSNSQRRRNDGVCRQMGSCFSCCSKDRVPHHSKAQPTGQALNPPESSQPLNSQHMGQAAPSVLRHSLGTRASEESAVPPQCSGASIGSNGSNSKLLPMQKLPSDRKVSVASCAVDSSKRISGSSREVSDMKIAALFETYYDVDENCILADGIERLCTDLNVQPEEFRVLLLAWKFNAETMCRFSRMEFVEGCRCLQVDSVRQIQSRLPDLVEEVGNKDRFRDFYRWTYTFGLDSEQLQRILPVDMAINLWRLVFTLNEPSILPRWISFLEKHPIIQGIPKDTWDTFLNFAEVIDDDLGNYDETEAWPALFDDFVEYENDRQNQNLVSELSEKDSNSFT